MQLPSVDRTPPVRPAAEAVSPAVNRVNPVPAVNPPVSSVAPVTPAEPSPSVIDRVNPALKTNEGERVYTSVSDPGRRGSEAATAPKDWTIHRPAPEKAELPPPKPLSQVLMEHLRTVWSASASAIHVEQVNQALTQPTPVDPAQAPGILAKAILTYEPSKVKQNEKL